MKVMNLIRNKAVDNENCRGVTIAFLGDSVTQGCFEVYSKKDGTVGTIFEREYTYHNNLSKIMGKLYPTVPVNIINAGINGDSAPHGLERLESDVLRHNPDLVVVCYGLNDVHEGKEKIYKFEEALRGILTKLKEKGVETIFMTPNMMNTDISIHIQEDHIRNIAAITADLQNGGCMDAYIDAARAVCKDLEITVCDCYAKWKKLYENGADITELLSNKINHPTREMNWLFAVSLLETMMK